MISDHLTAVTCNGISISHFDLSLTYSLRRVCALLISPSLMWWPYCVSKQRWRGDGWWSYAFHIWYWEYKMTSLVLMRCLYAHRQQLAVDLSQLHLEQARTLTVWVNQMHLNMTLRDSLDWKGCISYLAWSDTFSCFSKIKHKCLIAICIQISDAWPGHCR